MDEPRQLPLDLGHVTTFSRDDLVVTPANAEAAAMIDRWPDWPSPVVVVAGPSGAGKSHLAAIWRERSGAAVIRADSIERGSPSTAALIDDADDERLDEHGLFHLINTTGAARSHLLLTARRPPGAWNLRLPDLQSRMRAATTVELYAPDDSLLSGVITKLFADRQVEIEPQVVQFLVRRIERSLSTAIRVVDRLDRLALQQKVRVSRALAAEAIEAVDEGQGEFEI